MFNIAQYEATIAKVDAGRRQLAELVDRLPTVTASLTTQWYVNPAMSAALTKVSSVLYQLGRDVVATIDDFCRGTAAPVRFVNLVHEWREVKNLATAFAGDLQPVALNVGDYWQGRAADAYRDVIPSQMAAATRIGVMADKAQAALGWSASAGIAFYVGVLLVLIKFIVSFVGVVALFGSVAFSWAGIVLAIGEAELGFAELLALATLLATALGTQAVQMGNLYTEAADASAFPAGHWPSPRTDRYLDATVADGDADWSMRGR